MKRPIVLATLLLGVNSGCVSPSPHQSASYAPELFVLNSDRTARAFRVDIEDKERPAPGARHVLSPITLGDDGRIPTQFPLPPTTSKGIVAELDPKLTLFKESQVFGTCSVLVRVYRPGYRTIEVRPGANSSELKWQVADLVAQEKAIDDLLGVPRVGEWWTFIAVAPCSELYGSPTTTPTLGDSGLQPGSVSATHRDVLLFAAGEYARLANTPEARSAGMEKARQRLDGKAAIIKRYADELTTEEFYRRQHEANSRQNP